MSTLIPSIHILFQFLFVLTSNLLLVPKEDKPKVDVYAKIFAGDCSLFKFCVLLPCMWSGILHTNPTCFLITTNLIIICFALVDRTHILPQRPKLIPSPSLESLWKTLVLWHPKKNHFLPYHSLEKFNKEGDTSFCDVTYPHSLFSFLIFFMSRIKISHSFLP